MAENRVFGRGLWGFVRKMSFFAWQKFLKFLKTSFKKFLSGCRAEPCAVRDAFSLPRGAAPWNPASFFERKKQRSVYGRKLGFRQELFGISPRKTPFFTWQKFLKFLKTSFKKFLSRCRAEPCAVRDAFSPPRGAAPWNPASFFERKKQRSIHGRKLGFRQGLFGISPRKTPFFALQKFLKFLKTSFKKFLSGCRAEPCGYGGRGSPQGAPPLGILLPSLKERSKEAFMAENCVFGWDIKTVFDHFKEKNKKG